MYTQREPFHFPEGYNLVVSCPPRIHTVNHGRLCRFTYKFYVCIRSNTLWLFSSFFRAYFSYLIPFRCTTRRTAQRQPPRMGDEQGFASLRKRYDRMQAIRPQLWHLVPKPTVATAALVRTWRWRWLLCWVLFVACMNHANIHADDDGRWWVAKYTHPRSDAGVACRIAFMQIHFQVWDDILVLGMEIFSELGIALELWRWIFYEFIIPLHTGSVMKWFTWQSEAASTHHSDRNKAKHIEICDSLFYALILWKKQVNSKTF